MTVSGTLIGLDFGERRIGVAVGETSIGIASTDAAGSARLIAESPDLAFAPDALRVSLEPYDTSQVPLGPSVLTWPDH